MWQTTMAGQSLAHHVNIVILYMGYEDYELNIYILQWIYNPSEPLFFPPDVTDRVVLYHRL